MFLFLLYGKPSLAQIHVLWLVLSRSGFCSTDFIHGNGPTRVFLFWSEAGKFKISYQISEKKKTVNMVKLPEKAKKIEIFPKSQRWMKKLRRTFFKRVLLSKDLETFDAETETGITECHITYNLLTELARTVLGNIGPRWWQYCHHRGPICPSTARASSVRKRLIFLFFFKQKTAYEIGVRLVGSEMCIRDSAWRMFFFEILEKVQSFSFFY